MDIKTEDAEFTAEENFDSLPDEEIAHFHFESLNSPVSLHEDRDEPFSTLPDEEIKRNIKRIRSETRTVHIIKTCVPSNGKAGKTVIERRTAIAKEKKRIEKKCETAPSVVPVHVSRCDIGRQIVFWATASNSCMGNLRASTRERFIHLMEYEHGMPASFR